MFALIYLLIDGPAKNDARYIGNEEMVKTFTGTSKRLKPNEKKLIQTRKIRNRMSYFLDFDAALI